MLKCVVKETSWVELHLKKNICIPRSFLVINVCNQGKTLCSPCILRSFKLQPGDGLIKTETFCCYVFLINYILCNKVVLYYEVIYLY
jgi:hypothetical protein